MEGLGPHLPKSEDTEEKLVESAGLDIGINKADAVDQDSYSDEEEEEEEEGEEEVQLGFAEPILDSNALLFKDSNWENWDGGKIGGKPIWLNPIDLPSCESMLCKSCGVPLSFILQVYCPLDDSQIKYNQDAFHRSLYLFSCRKLKCVENNKDGSSLRVLRCQLPRENLFYPFETTKAAAPYYNASINSKVNLCEVCGCRGTSACAKCKSVSYCSRVHQIEHWKAGHKERCCKPIANTTNDSKRSLNSMADQLPSVFPEYEIVVEAEVLEDELGLEQSEEYKCVVSNEVNDSDRSISQKNLNEMTGASVDAISDTATIKFLTRISYNEDQCLRYARWGTGKPLWVSTENVPAETSIPNCPCCGGERRFEFQVMPQLLHFLEIEKRASGLGLGLELGLESRLLNDRKVTEKSHAEKTRADAQENSAEAKCCLSQEKDQGHRPIEGKDKDKTGEMDDGKTSKATTPAAARVAPIDFGTIAVFTCVNSCPGTKDGESQYLQEFTWLQPALK